MWSSLASSSGRDRETLLEFVEVTFDVDELRLGGGGLINGLAKLGPAGLTLAVPSDVLARHQHARVIEHLLGLGRRGDGAVRDDGNLDARLDRGEGVVFGLAAITAGARAAVHGERLYAALFGDARDRDAVAVIGVPARAYLERHRDIDGLHHRFEYARHQRLVLQERGARHHVAHLLRGAAHVDVDDLRAVIGVVARNHDQQHRNDACDLHRAWLHLADVIDALLRFHAVPQERKHKDHLRYRHARAEFLAQLAEGAIGDARHGGKDDIIGEMVGTNPHDGAASSKGERAA